MSQQVRFEVSDAFEHPAWDAFVETAPGGHHVQTSLWAQVKATVGMDSFRVTAHEDGRLVAGGQALVQSVPVLGKVGLVPRGPLVSGGSPELRAGLVNRIRSTAFERRLRHLTIQPPVNDAGLESVLESLRFKATPQTIAPPASLLIDLSAPLDDVMARMHKKTRYNIRLAGRRGVTVREGTDEDLEAYLAMVVSTAARQGFTPFPGDYYKAMRDTFEPRGHLRFTIAEFEGEIVAGQLVVAFGDLVVNKLPAWSGAHGKHHPNELLHWEAIRWAKEQGYTAYDFEGIVPSVARAIEAGEDVCSEDMASVTKFKLGFGGEARVFPGAYFDTSNSLTRLAYSSMARTLEWESTQRVIAALRTRSSAVSSEGGS